MNAAPIGPELGIALMMNNYLHDVATALLLASAVALWAMLRRWDEAGGPGAARFFLAVHRSLTRLARLSLAWIVLGGIPRTLFYREFEWANAAGRGQVAALVVKHVLAFAFVAAGAWLWMTLRRRVRELEAAAGRPEAVVATKGARHG
ncbi:MAG TPA: hypothetical protein VFI16_05460 [Anaeromyxobacteraceae bacterium]|nr:hypothetical protein [Anaeromyxobacteraceae bacterium]